MVLKLLAILPSGSAGKFLKKIWNLEKKGGEEAILLPYYDPPFKCRVPKLNFRWLQVYSPKGLGHFIIERHFGDILVIFLNLIRILLH